MGYIGVITYLLTIYIFSRENVKFKLFFSGSIGKTVQLSMVSNLLKPPQVGFKVRKHNPTNGAWTFTSTHGARDFFPASWMIS